MVKNSGSSPAYWRALPMFVGIAGVLLTLLVWFAVHQREMAVREQLLAERLAGAGEIVETHLESLANALQRMARRWEIRPQPVHAEWLADAGLYVRHDADYRALLWLDATGSARWWITRTPDGIATDRTGADVRWARPLLAACRARTAPGPFCAPGEGPGQNHLLIILPISKQNEIVGYIAGVFDLPRLLSATLHPGVLPAYTIAILDRGQPLHQRAGTEPAADLFQETALALPGLDWRLRVWPAPGELTHAPSLLSMLILASGLLMSTLLAITIRLAQMSARRSIELGRAITACAAAGETLRHSEARYRAVVEDQTELICRFTPDGALTFVNPAYGRYFGATPSALVGRNWLEFLPAEERAEVRRRFQSLTSENPIVTYQHRAVLPSGEVRWQEWTDRAIFDEHGRPVEFQSVGRDITAHRRTDEELRATERLFQQLADNVHEVFWVLDPAHKRLLYASPAFEELWGIGREQFLADPESALASVHPADRARLRDLLRDMYTARTDAEYRTLHDGVTRCLRSRTFPIHNEAGELHRIVGISEDITDRKQQEAAHLQQAERQRDTLVREVHHRIKNHLQGVMGLLRRHAQEQPELAGALEGALTQVQSIATVHGLHSRTPHRHLRLDELVRAVVRVTEEIGPLGGGIALELSDRPAVELADTEAVPVALIVNELICNAVKHAAAVNGEPRVNITLTGHDATACLHILNPCPALPPGFDFASGRGLGTGLSLVQSLLPSRGAALTFTHADGQIEAELCLQPPVIAAIVNPAPPGHEP
jgi:PAS domain S-box-containing protein